MIKDSRGRIDYDETGTGPTVVLVPGSCSTGAAWRPIMKHWENRFRCVTTSLLGYGGTAERRTALDSSITHEAEMIETVIRFAGTPVHLVGHSFGGLSALAVAQRRRVPLRSLTIIEAPAPELLRMMFEHEDYFAFRKMTDEYFAAYKAGDRIAIAQMIDFYGGAGTFAGWPERVRDYAIETTPVNLLDWKSVYGFGLTPALLAGVRIPTLVLDGRQEPSGGQARQPAFGPVYSERKRHQGGGRRAFHDLDACQGSRSRRRTAPGRRSARIRGDYGRRLIAIERNNNTSRFNWPDLPIPAAG